MPFLFVLLGIILSVGAVVSDHRSDKQPLGFSIAMLVASLFLFFGNLDWLFSLGWRLLLEQIPSFFWK